MKDKYPQRKSPRMQGWDYSRHGIYFLTICSYKRKCLFGVVVNGEMKLNPAGNMVQTVWAGLQERNPGLVLDEFVVMPNHLHAVVGLIDPQIAGNSSLEPAAKRTHLSNVVKKFKTYTMNQYKLGVMQQGWPPYDGHMWHRSFADHIIETERDLQNHREYTYFNPLRWHLDELNPKA